MDYWAMKRREEVLLCIQISTRMAPVWLLAIILVRHSESLSLI